MATEPLGESGTRAAALYDRAYARRYRDRDEQIGGETGYRALVTWLGELSASAAPPRDVLDLGCGTGRHFWALRGVRTLTGLDASPAMLAEAGRPVQGARIDAQSIALVHGDLETHDFAPQSFDLVYSIGVLAEHVPFTAALAARVARWLRPGGLFAFTTVHPDSPSVPRTASRRLARLILPILGGRAAHALHARLMSGGAYGDERWVRQCLAPALAVERFDLLETDVHLHGRCVARRVA